jgi:hypothetical protein
MNTDALIRLLAADGVTERPVGRVLAILLLPALAAAALVLWLTLGFRADLGLSITVPESAFRFVITGAAGALGLRLALLLSRPEGQGIARLWPLGAMAALALAALGHAWITTPDGARQMALVGKTMTTCLVTIPILSILPVAALLAAMHRGAATSPATAGFCAGIAGSGFAAMIYALHCTEDSPLFYVTWYGLAMASVTLVTTLIATRALRW